MIETLVIEGGSYPDALANRFYASHTDSGIRTHFGTVPLPPGDPQAPLRLRITKVNGFQIAGEPHNNANGAWHWTGSWTRDPRQPHGVGGVIFDRAGVLHVLTNQGPGTPSGGYRYVDEQNRIVTGDETLNNPSLGLSEYTQHGDIAVGQSHRSYGTVAIHDGTRYVLVAAHGPVGSRFIHFDREGDECAVAVWCPSGASVEGRHYGPCAVIRWFHTDDLPQFPVEHVVITPNPVPNPGTPVPDPGTPMPVIPVPPNRKSVAERVINANRHLLDGTHSSGRLLCRLVVDELRKEDQRWGLNWKRAKVGDQSADVIAYRFDDVTRIVDIISRLDDPDPNKRQPIWHVHSVEEAGKVLWFWDGVDPQPPPKPDPQPPQTCQCADKIAALEGVIDGLTDRLVELESQPEINIDAKIAAKLAAELKDVARVGDPVRVPVTLRQVLSDGALHGSIQKP